MAFEWKELLLGRPEGGDEGNEDAMEAECECEGWRGCASVAIADRYCITFFVLSVFPAPDSPLWTAN